LKEFRRRNTFFLNNKVILCVWGCVCLRGFTVYIHTYIHTHIHTYIHTYTYMPTYIHIRMHTLERIHTRAYTYACADAHTQSHTRQTNRHTRNSVHTRTLTHNKVPGNVFVDRRTHTQTHTQFKSSHAQSICCNTNIYTNKWLSIYIYELITCLIFTPHNTFVQSKITHLHHNKSITYNHFAFIQIIIITTRGLNDYPTE